MSFTYKDGVKIRNIIEDTHGGKISRDELGLLLRRETGVMMKWWIKNYAMSMVASQLLRLERDGTFSVILEEKKK